MNIITQTVREPIDQAPNYSEAALKKSIHLLDRLFGPQDHNQLLTRFAANVLLCTCPDRDAFNGAQLPLVELTPADTDYEMVDDRAQIILDRLATGSGCELSEDHNGTMSYDPRTGLFVETSSYPIRSEDSMISVERSAQKMIGDLVNVRYTAEVL